MSLIDEAIEKARMSGTQHVYFEKRLGAPGEQIEDAENRLGFKFPLSYRCFLREYGVGSFGSFEVFGLCPGGNDSESELNIVWMYHELRNADEIPSGFIPIVSLGDADYACLDTNISVDGECPVVVCEIAMLEESGSHQVIASSFERYFSESIDYQL